MRSFIIFIYFLIFSFFTAIGEEAGFLFKEGNQYYAEGNYAEAIRSYEKIVDDGLVAPELFFNLGNAYYKSGKIAYAILNYEKAKKLSPADDDIQFNLKLANSKTTDKIDELPVIFINEWKSSLISSLTETEWSVLSIISVLLLTIGIAIYVVSKKTILKQISFWSSVLLVISGISLFFIAHNSYTSANEYREAIVLSSSATVKGSPNEKGTKLFILHEGTKVKIESTEDKWTEIRLANGNVGWVMSSTLGII